MASRRKLSDDHKLRISNAMTGRKHSEETIRRRGDSIRRAWAAKRHHRCISCGVLISAVDRRRFNGICGSLECRAWVLAARRWSSAATKIKNDRCVFDPWYRKAESLVRRLSDNHSNQRLRVTQSTKMVRTAATWDESFALMIDRARPRQRSRPPGSWEWRLRLMAKSSWMRVRVTDAKNQSIAASQEVAATAA